MMRKAFVAFGLMTAAAQAQPAAAQPASAAPSADWDLTPLYASADEAAADRDEIATALPGLAAWKGKLSDVAAIKAALTERSRLRSRVSRYYAWAILRQSHDGSDEAAGADVARATELSTKLSATAAYMESELVALGNARLAQLAREPELLSHSRTLELLAARAAHVLPASEEALVVSVQHLLQQTASIRDTLFNVELPYPTVTMNGKPRRLNAGGTRRALTDPDRAARKAAWDAFTETQDQFKFTQAALLSDYLAGVAWEAKARGWASQTEMVTASDPMPAAAFNALTAEAEKTARGPLTRYVALKARALNLPALATYDLSAPIVPDNRHYSIEQAQAITLAGLAPMGREYQDRLARGFAGKWIDWHPGPTKAPGGLTMYGAADAPAYISISYTDDASGLTIFAHEWGHWLNWDYARESGRQFETLAPVTSTNDLVTFVHEMLVSDAEIAKAKTHQERVAALSSAIEALRGPYYTVVAQATFDRSVRDAADKGAVLTPEVISKLYCEARDRYSPSAIVRGDRDCLGWVTEPYVYYDMYFYRYLLATSAGAWFAERLSAGDKAAPEQLKRLLREGSALSGPELLKEAGFDVSNPASYTTMGQRLERLTTALEQELRKSS